MLTPGQKPTSWLSWAAAPYALAIRLRTYGYERGWLAQQRLPVPVISIGNLTLGGTGKTPIVIEVAQWLLSAGRRLAVLSRGYRRTSRDSFLLVSDGSKILATQEEAGDEPYLIARRCPSAVVAVGADRYRSGRQVLDTFPVDCILLDDGFQHMALYRDVNVLLVDATDAQGLEQLFPAGRLREPLTAGKRASAVIITRAEDPSQVHEVIRRLQSAIPALPITGEVVFRALDLLSLSGESTCAQQSRRGQTALLVSGIGHPDSFRATAQRLGLTVLDQVIYPDHYGYSRQEVEKIETRAAAVGAQLVLTTEKDAAKIEPHLREPRRWWAVRLTVEWRTGEAEIRKMVMDTRSMAERRIGA